MTPRTPYETSDLSFFSPGKDATEKEQELWVLVRERIKLHFALESIEGVLSRVKPRSVRKQVRKHLQDMLYEIQYDGVLFKEFATHNYDFLENIEVHDPDHRKILNCVRTWWLGITAGKVFFKEVLESIPQKLALADFRKQLIEWTLELGEWWYDALSKALTDRWHLYYDGSLDDLVGEMPEFTARGDSALKTNHQETKWERHRRLRLERKGENIPMLDPPKQNHHESVEPQITYNPAPDSSYRWRRRGRMSYAAERILAKTSTTETPKGTKPHEVTANLINYSIPEEIRMEKYQTKRKLRKK